MILNGVVDEHTNHAFTALLDTGNPLAVTYSYIPAIDPVLVGTLSILSTVVDIN